MSKSLTSRRFIRFAGKMFFCALAPFLYCGALVGSTWAEDAHYSSVASNQHMKEWLLLGPIPAQEADAKPNTDNARKMGLERDLLEQAGGEAKIKPEPGKKLDVRGGECTWLSHESESDTVDLIDALGQHDFAVAYAAATIESPEAKTEFVGLGSDDGVRVWLNGELIHDNSTPRAVAVDDDVFAVKLKQGTNRLLTEILPAGSR